MNLKFSKKKLLAFILLIPFFKPGCFINNVTLWWLYNLLIYADFVGILLYYLIKNKKPSILTRTFFLFEVLILISTIIGKGDLQLLIMNFLRIITLSGIFDIFSEKIRNLIEAFLIHFEICVYLNLLTVLLYPEGMIHRISDAYGITNEWFLGAYNSFIIWLFPALLFAWVYKYYSGKKLCCYLLTFAIAFTEFINGSGTGKIAVLLFISFLLLPFLKKIFSPIRSILFAVILFIFIIVIRKYDLLEPIVVGLLGRDMTFSNRIYIWNNAIMAIKNKPLFGYGVLSADEMINYLGHLPNKFWLGATHCHCHILQVVFQSGIFGLLLMAFIYYIVLKNCILKPLNNISRLCSWSIAIFTIIGITEVFDYALMYSIFMLAFYSRNLVIGDLRYQCKTIG